MWRRLRWWQRRWQRRWRWRQWWGRTRLRRGWWARWRELGPIVQHVRCPADPRLLEPNLGRPRCCVHLDDVWIWERREAFAVRFSARLGVDLSSSVIKDVCVASVRGSDEGNHHLGCSGRDVVLVRRLWRAGRIPLRDLSIPAVFGRVERVRRHGAVGDKPPVRKKLCMAANEAHVESVDGAPLRQHLPTVVQQGGAAR